MSYMWEGGVSHVAYVRITVCVCVCGLEKGVGLTSLSLVFAFMPRSSPCFSHARSPIVQATSTSFFSSILFVQVAPDPNQVATGVIPSLGTLVRCALYQSLVGVAKFSFDLLLMGYNLVSRPDKSRAQTSLVPRLYWAAGQARVALTEV